MDKIQVKCPTCSNLYSKHYIEQAGECHACIMKPIESELESMAHKNKKILAQVKSMVSMCDYKLIEEDLSESDWVYDFALVEQSSTLGDIDCEIEFEHGFRVVNQTTNGGMSGDEYAGDVFIPVSPNMFFKYSYAM